MNSDKKTTKLLFITSSVDGRIEHRTFSELYKQINLKKNDLKANFNDVTNNFFVTVRDLFFSDVILVHSSLFLSFPYILLGRIFGKKVIGFVWDEYPVLIRGKRYDKRLIRRIADFIENFSNYLCTEIVVPSNDFVCLAKNKKSHVIRFWPPIIRCNNSNKLLNQELRIVFAGQINDTRDLIGAVQRLKILCDSSFKVIVASGDKLPRDLEGDACVEYVGFLSRDEMYNLIQSCNFGLISLTKGFSGPGFPSKTFDYLSAGKPCLYFGPRLSDYLSMIIDSGVGGDFDQLENLNTGTYLQFFNNFNEKILIFNQKACLTDDDLDKISELVKMDS